MNFISLFSGIGGFDLGLERSGMTCVAQVEIDAKCQDVLNRHWPDVPKYTDVREFGHGQVAKGSVDLICGGFPCQDLSVAGKRAGLDGERSGLWFEFARIVDELEPEWVVIENVPGLLSSAEGRDFAIIIRWLAVRGYGVAWRVFDAQYFRVAQRRGRIFVVGHLARRERSVGSKDIQDGQRVSGLAAKVLFESEGVRWDPPARRETGETFAFSPGQSAEAGSISYHEERTPTLKGAESGTNRVPAVFSPVNFGDGGGGGYQETDVVNSVDATKGSKQTNLVSDLAQIAGKLHGSRPSEISQPLNTISQMAVYSLDANQDGGDVEQDIAPTLRHQGDGAQAHQAYNKPAVAIVEQNNMASTPDMPSLRASETPNFAVYDARGNGEGDLVNSLIGDHQNRVTDYTSIVVDEIAAAVSSKWPKQAGGPAGDEVQNLTIGGGTGVRRFTPVECERLQGFPDDWTSGQSDSARYRQIGNAVAVPVIEWLGKRIYSNHKVS